MYHPFLLSKEVAFLHMAFCAMYDYGSFCRELKVTLNWLYCSYLVFFKKSPKRILQDSVFISQTCKTSWTRDSGGASSKEMCVDGKKQFLS